VDAAKLRAWWWRRQGLDGSLRGAAPAAKAAAAPLDLRPAEPGATGCCRRGRGGVARLAPPATPHHALVSSLDAITATRRGLAALVDEAVARTTRWGARRPRGRALVQPRLAGEPRAEAASDPRDALRVRPRRRG
jgi:hypothetical protein